MKTKQTNQTGLLLLRLNPAFCSIDIQNLSHLQKSLVYLTHMNVVRLLFPRLSRKICHIFGIKTNLYLLENPNGNGFLKVHDFILIYNPGNKV